MIKHSELKCSGHYASVGDVVKIDFQFLCLTQCVDFATTFFAEIKPILYVKCILKYYFGIFFL